MLTYLVNPPSRRRLVELLWGKALSGSASDFSRLANVPYATAHRELREMKKVGLAHAEHVGNSVVYSANLSHPESAMLKNLVKNSGNTTLSLEEELTNQLRLSHQDATVARMLPLNFAEQMQNLHFPSLALLAKRAGEQRTLGFFLDTTTALTGDKRFAQLAKPLQDKRVKNSEYFFGEPRGKFSKMLVEKNTPPLAKKWHFKMNMGMDSFETLFKKFRATHE